MHNRSKASGNATVIGGNAGSGSVPVISSGAYRFILNGWVDYQDIYGEAHSTTICWEWPTAGTSVREWQVCPTGNWAK